MKIWDVDVRCYQAYNRRLQILLSYRGTPDALPTDEQRIDEMRARMDKHFFEMSLCRFNRAHWELQQC